MMSCLWHHVSWCHVCGSDMFYSKDMLFCTKHILSCSRMTTGLWSHVLIYSRVFLDIIIVLWSHELQDRCICESRFPISGNRSHFVTVVTMCNNSNLCERVRVLRACHVRVMWLRRTIIDYACFTAHYWLSLQLLSS